MTEEQATEDPGKEFIGRVDGMTINEKYFAVCQVLKVQKSAAERNDFIINKLNNEIVQLKSEARSTANQMLAAQQSASHMSAEIGRGHAALEEEVHRLRRLCASNGINPEG